MVFLTPHIIRDSAALAALSSRKKSDFARQMSEDRTVEALVKLRAGVTEADFDALLKENRMRMIEKQGEGLFLIGLPEDKGFLEMKDRLERSGMIESIEPDLKVRGQ